MVQSGGPTHGISLNMSTGSPCTGTKEGAAQQHGEQHSGLWVGAQGVSHIECLDDHEQGPHQLCPVPQCGQHSHRPEPELSPTGGGRGRGKGRQHARGRPQHERRVTMHHGISLNMSTGSPCTGTKEGAAQQHRGAAQGLVGWGTGGFTYGVP